LNFEHVERDACRVGAVAKRCERAASGAELTKGGRGIGEPSVVGAEIPARARKLDVMPELAERGGCALEVIECRSRAASGNVDRCKVQPDSSKIR
jgi:hypothetical protein